MTEYRQTGGDADEDGDISGNWVGMGTKYFSV